MTDLFILIPGRSSRQGVSLNEGKYTDDYKDEISRLRMNPDDMLAMNVVAGDRIRVWDEIGEFTAPCVDAKDELPRGMLFIAYGDLTCRVMPADTHGSGMPDSKGLDVFAEPAGRAAVVAPAAVVGAAAGVSAANASAVSESSGVESPVPPRIPAEPAAVPAAKYPRAPGSHATQPQSPVAVGTALILLALVLVYVVSVL